LLQIVITGDIAKEHGLKLRNYLLLTTNFEAKPIPMKTIDDIHFEGKRALVRVDFNVPLNDEQKITDHTRIQATLPTLNKILSEGGSLVLMSHLGRPKDGPDAKFSLRHVVQHLSEVLGRQVKFSGDCIGDKALRMSSELGSGEVLLLENLRFHPEEKAGDRDFAEKLSAHGDVYVNDAFGTAHRAHASTAIIAEFFPERKCFGYVMAREIENVGRVLNSTEKPVAAVIGGAKVSSKITIIENLLPRIDKLIIGGGMAYTFSRAMGASTGNSLVEEDYLETARRIVKLCEDQNVELLLPIDSLNGNTFANDAEQSITSMDAIPDGWMGLDIGPDTVEIFSKALHSSRVILWNGPVGVFELDNFSNGTRKVGEAIAKATEAGSFSLVGGGDSVAAAKKYNLDSRVSYVSTGGGAMLEYLEGKVLPGIAAV
jgi:phosphoglycerate kinase